MLISFLRAWQRHVRQTELAALARRLGPHLARDIGIDDAACARFFPIIKTL